MCLLLSVFTLLHIVPSDVNAQQGRIIGMPDVLTVHEGQTFDVTFFVDPGSEPVSVVDFVLSYDQKYVEAIQIERLQSPLDMNQISDQINPEEGKVLYGAFKIKQPWPSEPFRFVLVRFKAIHQIKETLLQHNTDVFPYSSMAFSGKSTLASAPPIKLTILPSISTNAESLIAGSIAVTLTQEEENNRVIANFTAKESGKATFDIREIDGDFAVQLLNNNISAGENYQFEIDTSVLLTGKYMIELNLPEAKHHKEITINSE